MNRRSKYILAVLLGLIVYEVYLIILYAYRDYGIESYMGVIIRDNETLRKRIEEKDAQLAYVRTNAYADRITKESQNLKNPGEEIIVLVSPEEKQRVGSAPLDTASQLVALPPPVVQPTAGMSNPEKWIYYTFRRR